MKMQKMISASTAPLIMCFIFFFKETKGLGSLKDRSSPIEKTIE